MLKIQIKDKRHDAIWVVEKLYAIGRSPTNNLVVNDPSISPVHAKLITKESKLYLKDNNSSNGCFVNNQRITQKEIVPGDLVRLGDVEIEILAPRESLSQAALTDEQLHALWALVADSSWLSGQEFPICSNRATIGRGNQCDITIPGTHLSRQHAELTVQGNLLHVRDLASANGTYINDERISQGIARPGDRLRLDVYSFRVIGPDRDTDKTRIRREMRNGYTKVERKPLSDKPKRWKTRSTSPGNREEPVYGGSSKLLTWLSILLCITIVAVVAYLLTNR